jgi:hypothetical protein
MENIFINIITGLGVAVVLLLFVVIDGAFYSLIEHSLDENNKKVHPITIFFFSNFVLFLIIEIFYLIGTLVNGN